MSSLVVARVVHTPVLGGYRCEIGSHLSKGSSGGAIQLRDCVVDGGAGGLVDFACCFFNTSLHVIAHVFVVWTTLGPVDSLIFASSWDWGKTKGIIVGMELSNCRNHSFFAQDWPL